MKCAKEVQEVFLAEVVSNFTIRTHTGSIGIMQNDPQGRPSFAQLTGAQNLITGSYYLQNDELTFKLELIDATEGKLRFAFEPITGQEDEIEEVITQLRQTVSGYWAARKMVANKRINTPNFEAYKLYLEAIEEAAVSPQALENILALDSTFYLPRIHFLNSNRYAQILLRLGLLEDLDRYLSNIEHHRTANIFPILNTKIIHALATQNPDEIRESYSNLFAKASVPSIK